MATECCNKFMEVENTMHIMDLGRPKQRLGKSLISFIKRYKDMSLQCKETLPEPDHIYRCINNVENNS